MTCPPQSDDHPTAPQPATLSHPGPPPTEDHQSPNFPSPSPHPIPPAFTARKTTILASLAQPSETYIDLSPKGSVDNAIKDLIDRLNVPEGVVTTSSCAGRVSVFLEGVKNGRGKGKGKVFAESERGEGGMKEDVNGVGAGNGGAVEQAVVPGGKGRGGRWLFVSHEPVKIPESEGGAMELLLGVSKQKEDAVDLSELDTHSTRYVRFQFEPMILHIQTASLHHAAPILASAINAGFRESGIQSLKNLDDANTFPMVAIRSAGLAFESLVAHLDEGGEVVRNLVSDGYLRLLLRMANERFKANAERTCRFQEDLFRREGPRPGWEDAESRQARKKAEGLERRRLLRMERTD